MPPPTAPVGKAKAEVTRQGALSVQVCVPKEWGNEQIINFAEKEYPCGTTCGWGIRTKEELLAGSPSRNPCSDRKNFVHITLDA